MGLVRRLPDRVEFEAVRSARRQGRSWSEIAVRLGVMRQSAWERWRDVDEGAASAGAVGDAAAELWGRAQRRRSSSVVPTVVGMSWTDARQLLRANALVGMNADQDGPALVTDRSLSEVVVDQSPGAGAKW